MECLATELKDAKLIKPKVFADARGFFLEGWRRVECGVDHDIAAFDVVSVDHEHGDEIKTITVNAFRRRDFHETFAVPAYLVGFDDAAFG